MENKKELSFAERVEMAAEKSTQERRKCSHETVPLVDRISDLPDSILCWIMSFLPITEVVPTSILAKRWKFLWTQVPSLEFYDGREPFLNSSEQWNSEKFVKFVNRFLLLCNGQCLNKFMLRLDFYSDAFYIETWVSTAIARNVRILYVSCSRIELPNSIFKCETLEFIELEDEIVITAPSFVCLPRLMTLNLIRLDDRSLEYLSEILAGCAVLQTLFIERVASVTEVFKIASPTLKTLRLDIYASRFFDGIHKLEINAPALEYLYLRDRVSRRFSIECPKALYKAELDFCFYDEIDYCNSMVKVFSALQNVEVLTLSRGTMQTLSKATAQFSEKFDMLTMLVAENLCCEMNCLLSLLENSDNLEVLHLSLISYCFAHNKDPHWRNRDQVPKCLLTSLKEISVQEVRGKDDDELAIISYFLQHGSVLERVKLLSNSAIRTDGRFRLLQEISMFPRKSPTCRIAFF